MIIPNKIGKLKREGVAVPISGKELAKLFMKKGYSLEWGKGSHMKLRKRGKIIVVIPNHKELSSGLEKALLKKLASED